MNLFEYAILPFKRYFDFSGRSSRSEFWWYTLLIFVVQFIIGIIDAATFDPWSYDSFRFIDLISLIWGIFSFIPSLAVSVRRLHDINRTGLWLLLWVGLYILAIVLFILGIALSFEREFGGAGLSYILGVVMILGTIVWSIVWYCLPPVDLENRFGPNPLLRSASSPSSPASATPQPKATRVSQNPVPSAPLASETTSSASVNDRLRDLNKMYEDGLIDEKEFKSKKKKLLDEL